MKKLHVLALTAVFVLGMILVPALAMAEFKYAGPPAFTLETPDDFKFKDKLTTETGQVMNGTMPSGVSVDAAVSDPTKGMALKDYCEKEWMPGLVKTWKHLDEDDVEFLGSEEFELEDETMAQKCEIEWPWTDGSTILTTYIIVADKGGKRIVIATHPWAAADDVLEIIESLNFDLE